MIEEASLMPNDNAAGLPPLADFEAQNRARARFAAGLVFVALWFAMLFGVWAASEVWDALTTRSWFGVIAGSAVLAGCLTGAGYFSWQRLFGEQREALQNIHQVIERARAGDGSARSYLDCGGSDWPIGAIGRSVA